MAGDWDYYSSYNKNEKTIADMVGGGSSAAEDAFGAGRRHESNNDVAAASLARLCAKQARNDCNANIVPAGGPLRQRNAITVYTR